MKITFVQYIILGLVGVYAGFLYIQKFLQTDLFPYKGHDKTILLFTRNLSQEGQVYGPRMFTLWNLTHVFYYAIGAYLFPDKALLLWLLGLAWELLELRVNAFNFLDILWNTIGILLGLYAVRNLKH